MAHRWVEGASQKEEGQKAEGRRTGEAAADQKHRWELGEGQRGYPTVEEEEEERKHPSPEA